MSTRSILCLAGVFLTETVGLITDLLWLLLQIYSMSITKSLLLLAGVFLTETVGLITDLFEIG